MFSLPDVLEPNRRLGGSHIAAGGIVAEIGCAHLSSDIAAEIGAPGIGQRTVRSVINFLSGSEFYLAAIVEAWNSAEREHQTEVFRPLGSTAVESYLVVWLRAVIVRIHIHQVVGGIIIQIVAALRNVHRIGGIAEIVVHGEVDDVESRCL